MSSKNNSAQSGGVGFVGLLTLLFIGLKLTHNIDWSWWWVLSPSLITIGVCLLIIVFALVMAVVQHTQKQKAAAAARVAARK